MKRLFTFLVFLVTGAMLLSACGGGAGSGSDGGSSSSSSAVTAGSSGIKDASLLGKWISADGGTSYRFSDDFSVVISTVGDDINSIYNIASGGQGSGKVEIKETSGKVTWDYKITGDTLDMTTPEGRSRKLKKTT